MRFRNVGVERIPVGGISLNEPSSYGKVGIFLFIGRVSMDPRPFNDTTQPRSFSTTDR